MKQTINNQPSTINNLGFTLIELLIAIGIIGILVTLGFGGYSNIQKRSRDTKRKADLATIQKALEQYYSICSFAYPTVNIFTSGIACGSTTIMAASAIPKDPKRPPYPQYTYNAGTSVCARLEVGSTDYCVYLQQ